MSIGPVEWARKSSIGPCGSERTLKGSNVPRASTVGVTPTGGDAFVIATKAANETRAATAAMPSRVDLRPFTTPPSESIGRSDARTPAAGQPPYMYGSASRSQCELGSAAHELELRAHAELRVDVGEVRLDRALADVEPLADDARRESLDCEQGDLPLAPAEPWAAARGLRRPPAATAEPREHGAGAIPPPGRAAAL